MIKQVLYIRNQFMLPICSPWKSWYFFDSTGEYGSLCDKNSRLHAPATGCTCSRWPGGKSGGKVGRKGWRSGEIDINQKQKRFEEWTTLRDVVFVLFLLDLYSFFLFWLFCCWPLLLFHFGLQVFSIVQKYGQGVHPAVTAMTGNPEDLFSNQQGATPKGLVFEAWKPPQRPVRQWSNDPKTRMIFQRRRCPKHK